jgi:hypothetical protein
MTKQFKAVYVSWREARRRPLGLFAEDRDYARAAAQALEAALNDLAEDGWIVEKIFPAQGLTGRQASAFTVVAFK